MYHNGKLKELYYDWMLNKVCSKKQKEQYKKLFDCLDDIDFTYTNPLDENLESHGIDLRYRFAYETEHSQSPFIAVDHYMDDRPCSVLEMLIALCIHMDDITYDEDPSLWFWHIMNNMHLNQQTNYYFDADYVHERVDILLNRTFNEIDGDGGLFYFNNNRGYNLREVEFWCQAMWHITDIVKVV